MAAQSIADDGVGLDDNDLGGPGRQPGTASNADSNSILPAGSRYTFESGEDEANSSSSASNTTRPALERLNLEARTKAFRWYNCLARHPVIYKFEQYIGATVLDLADFWLCQGSPYDHVCLARANWREFRSCWRVGGFFTRAEFHLKLYTYLLRRTCALEALIERRYGFIDAAGLSATDKAFKVVVEGLVYNWIDMRPNIVDCPERGRQRTLMIDHPRLLRALEIVLGGKARVDGSSRVPMRFRVKRDPLPQETLTVFTDCEKLKKVEEVAFMSFEDVKDGEAWEMEMEIVAPGDAKYVCESREYEV